MKHQYLLGLSHVCTRPRWTLPEAQVDPAEAHSGPTVAQVGPCLVQVGPAPGPGASIHGPGVPFHGPGGAVHGSGGHVPGPGWACPKATCHSLKIQKIQAPPAPNGNVPKKLGSHRLAQVVAILAQNRNMHTNSVRSTQIWPPKIQVDW